MIKLQEKLKDKNIVLASASPRRQMLLRELGLHFIVRVRKIQEDYPEGLEVKRIAEYLSKKKAMAFAEEELDQKTLLITADTVVWFNGTLVDKPKNRAGAIQALKQLSGRKHMVTTGVCLRSKDKTKSFSINTEVFFRNLDEEEIIYYVDNYKPFDKAGAYGIQEWIGYVGIEKINGSFYNVMGLPLKALYEALLEF